MTRQIQLAMVAAAVVALAACTSRRAEPPETPPAVVPPANAAQLAAALRQGGLVLFVRHAATDRSRDDDAHVVLENCATQRNLSAAGRAQAEGIAAAIKRLHLPIEQYVLVERRRQSIVGGDDRGAGHATGHRIPRLGRESLDAKGPLPRRAGVRQCWPRK